jgi:hypothetical protein
MKPTTVTQWWLPPYCALLSKYPWSQYKFVEYENNMQFHTYQFDLCGAIVRTYNVQVVLLGITMNNAMRVWTAGRCCLNLRGHNANSLLAVHTLHQEKKDLANCKSSPPMQLTMVWKKFSRSVRIFEFLNFHNFLNDPYNCSALICSLV